MAFSGGMNACPASERRGGMIAPGDAMATDMQIWVRRYQRALFGTGASDSGLTLPEEFVLLWQDEKSQDFPKWKKDAFHMGVIAACLLELLGGNKVLIDTHKGEKEGIRHLLEVVNKDPMQVSYIDSVQDDVIRKTFKPITVFKFFGSLFGDVNATEGVIEALCAKEILEKKKKGMLFKSTKYGQTAEGAEVEEALKMRMQNVLFSADAALVATERDLALISLCRIADKHGADYKGMLLQRIFSGKMTDTQAAQAKKMIDKKLKETQKHVKNKPKPIKKGDVDRLLLCMCEADRDKLTDAFFLQEMDEKFDELCQLYPTDAGNLEENALDHFIQETFPPDERITIAADGEENAGMPSPYSMPTQDLLRSFDFDRNGAIDRDEFPHFARFCHAWKVNAYFSCPVQQTETGDNSCML